MANDALVRARALLNDITPLSFDCGRFCGAACCAPDADGQGGVYLLPGEESLLGGCPWGHVEQTELAPMLVCEKPCDRDARPFLCRIFPLTPWRRKDGTLSIRVDARAQSVCPLSRGGLQALRSTFVRNAEEACALLLEEEETGAFMEEWMREERAFRKELKRLQALF